MSACTPRAMRVQGPHVPHASPFSSRSQFSACARATAVVRLPTPPGPAKTRLGGSVWRTIARDSRSRTGRCPAIAENGILGQSIRSAASAVDSDRGTDPRCTLVPSIVSTPGKDHPLLSVIVPTRARVSTLPFTLATILNHQPRSFEVIVSDNCSEAGTREAVQRIVDDRLVYLDTGTRLSMTDNWEFAIGHARGRYVLFVG